MLDHLIEALQDLSSIDIQSYDIDFDNLIDNLAAQGVDLTQYTVEEIKGALDYALSADNVVSSGQPFTTVSFQGHIDDLYDPDIKRAEQSYLDNIKKMQRELNNNNNSWATFYKNQADQALFSQNYWEDCKKDALLNKQRSDIRMEMLFPKRK